MINQTNKNLIAIKKNLVAHIKQLAGEIGERNYQHYSALQAARDYIEQIFLKEGYPVQRQEFRCQANVFCNVEAQLKGKVEPEKILVLGAHYDSIKGGPGANNNASGVAVLLELARLLREMGANYTICFVAFANEEPPFTRTKNMGSYRYAQKLKDAHHNVVGMIALETLGYYSEGKYSQRFSGFLPKSYYPETGNFIAFVGNLASRRFVMDFKQAFPKKFPAYKFLLPGFLPGINASDHWSFWQFGFPAMMITDTAALRHPDYHTSEDTPDKINYDRLASLAFSLAQALAKI
ncbi:MAG: putative aminopeptidase [Gammaproteobacteria bacterium]|jgi:Zn-dependent M28 family amino/carboxypeptidase|nr:putative aminopeptidase [Gammaproteobacteria bacterium]